MRTFETGDLLFPETSGGKAPKSKLFSCNVASTTVILPAASGIRYRVLGALLGASASATFGFYASDTSLICGPFYFSQNGNMAIPVNEIGWCHTGDGQPLEGWTPAQAVVTGVLIYVED